MTTLRISDGRARLTANPTGTCRVCGDTYAKYKTTQTICAKLRCAAQVGKLQRKAEKAETKRRKEADKPLSYWAKRTQFHFNAYVRIRDAHLPCVSCGRMESPQFQAGHYLTVGARPELRFDEANVHKQCVHCNKHNHGAPVAYRIELIRRIGLAEVERLEGHNPPKKYTRESLKALQVLFRARAKELER